MRLLDVRLAAVAPLLIAGLSAAFQVTITDADPLRQTCSGMWKGKDTRIECESIEILQGSPLECTMTIDCLPQVSFDKGSAGTVSTLFYEFSDFDKVGKETKELDVFGMPVSRDLPADKLSLMLIAFPLP